MTEENELESLAREEILRDTQQAAERAAAVGPQGWMKCPLPRPNKWFLRNVLMQTSAKPFRSQIRRRRHHDCEDSPSINDGDERKRWHNRNDARQKNATNMDLKEERSNQRTHCSEKRLRAELASQDKHRCKSLKSDLKKT